MLLEELLGRFPASVDLAIGSQGVPVDPGQDPHLLEEGHGLTPSSLGFGG